MKFERSSLQNKRFATVRLIVGLLLIFFMFMYPETASPQSGRHVIAQYHFDEGSGSRVVDSSGNHLDGQVKGVARWTRGISGGAFFFDGVSRVSIPTSSRLELHHRGTISAWVRGHGSPLHFVKQPTSYPSMRGPYFQVVGDTIYAISNSDVIAQHLPSRNSDGRATADLTWDEWNIYTAKADISLSGWQDRQQTKAPSGGIEGKLQVVGNTLYAEYFGQDSGKVWQIWTASAQSDGTGWKAVQRTRETEGYRVEQEYRVQVVERHIYYAWPQKDDKDRWEVWTACSDLYGSDLTSTQRTADGGMPSYYQVYGEKVFYAYADRFTVNTDSPRNAVLFAQSDKGCHGWQVIKRVDDVFWSTLKFQITNGKLYFVYVGSNRTNDGQLFTGYMSTDGSGLHKTQRTFTRGVIKSPQLQVVGSKIYYSYTEADARWGAPQDAGTRQTATYAQSNLDGSYWKITGKSDPSKNIMAQFTGRVTVGGKSYYGAQEVPPPGSTELSYALLGSSGSNIVSKGDAYGLGVTALDEARGFINAGTDFLFQAKAPRDTSGAIADCQIDETWHFLVMTYDAKNLKLYVDGELMSSSPYRESIRANPFPVIIGDGFNGIVDEVTLYNIPLNNSEISRIYDATRLPILR
ncbi:MAG TPA: LamG domain-containing protein [Candidatus Angelobacter sp.]